MDCVNPESDTRFVEHKFSWPLGAGQERKYYQTEKVKHNRKSI